jgi:septal ring factor EnvC (AmiA/AmiB activator)
LVEHFVVRLVGPCCSSSGLQSTQLPPALPDVCVPSAKEIPHLRHLPILAHNSILYAAMKNRIGLVILVLVCVVLGVGFVMVKHDATKDHAEATVKIEAFSNKWVETSAKLDSEKQNAAQLYQELDKGKKSYGDLSNTFTEVSTTLVKAQTDLKTREEELKQRDAKIADLESQNQALDKQAADLSVAITNLTVQISDTQKKLATSEGDKAYLEKELQRLITEKAELEKQFNDITVLKAQVAKLREELSIARRIEWIRNGILAMNEQKGAQRLMQGFGSSQSQARAPKPNYDLNVEVTADGSVRVIPGITNTPTGATNAPVR